MSKGELIYKSICGWKPDVVNNGIIIDNNNVLFIASKMIVLYNFIEKTQSVTDLSYKGFATCLAVTPSKRVVVIGQYIPGQKAVIELLKIPFGKKFVVSTGNVEANVLFLLNMSDNFILCRK
jgi:hypothetical protein